MASLAATHSAGDGLSPFPARERRLLDAVTASAALDAPEVRRLASSLLGDGDRRTPFCSRLNNDGSPLQACVSLTPSRLPSWRLVGDPHSDIVDAGVRFRRARRTVSEVLAARTSDDFVGLVESALDRTQGDAVATSARWTGAVWTCAGVSGAGAAAYIDARWGTPAAQWARTISWIGTLTGRPVCAEVLAAAHGPTQLAAVAIEGSRASDARVKLYFRLLAAASLDTLGFGVRQRDVLAQFVDALVGDRLVSRMGVLLCLGLAAQSGSLRDVKLDLCGHCLALGPGELASTADRLASAFRAGPIDVAAMQPGVLTDLAFVGCGVTSAGEPRVNVYFKGHDS